MDGYMLRRVWLMESELVIESLYFIQPSFNRLQPRVKRHMEHAILKSTRS